MRVFTPALCGSLRTGLTLCRTRLVHAKVEKKKSTNQFHTSGCFLMSCFFFYPSLPERTFWIPYFIFPWTRFFIIVSESWINAVLLQWDSYLSKAPEGFTFLIPVFFFSCGDGTGGIVWFWFWNHEWNSSFFILGEGMEVVRGSAVLYFLLLWLLFIFGDFWQMCCRSVGIKAGRLRASWP